jgi:hypothetical protein
MARSCYILTDYDCGQRLSLALEKGAVRLRRARERGEWSCHTEQWSTTPGQGLRNFFVKSVPGRNRTRGVPGNRKNMKSRVLLVSEDRPSVRHRGGPGPDQAVSLAPCTWAGPS